MNLDDISAPRVQVAIANLYARLVKNTRPPTSDQGCWVWNGGTRKGYPRINIRRGGRAGKMVSLGAHRAILLLLECQGELEHFWDLNDLYSYARFDADHKCYDQPLCICPDHLQWLEVSPHSKKTRAYTHPDSRSHE